MRTKNLFFTLIAYLCSCMFVSAAAWQSSAGDLTDFASNKTHFTLTKGGEILYGSDAQNLKMGSYFNALDNCATLYYELEQEGGNYKLRTITKGGGVYSLWGRAVCYLNSQPNVGQATFNLGLNNQNGEDAVNGAVWNIEYNDAQKAFTLRNVANNGYLAGVTTSASPVYWQLVPQSYYDSSEFEVSEATNNGAIDKWLSIVTTEAKANVWDSQVSFSIKDALGKALLKDNEYTFKLEVKTNAPFEMQPLAIWDASTNRDQWNNSADVQYIPMVTVSKDWSVVEFTTDGSFAYDRLSLNIGNLGGRMQITKMDIYNKTNGNMLIYSSQMNSAANWSKVGYHDHVGYAIDDNTHTDFVFEGYDDADYTLMPLHQVGKNLVNSRGEAVTLHGVMDTPNSYFNSGKWEISDWGHPYDTDEDVRRCLGYFNTLLSAMVDHKQGSYCDLFRLHLDPAWTNDPNKEATNGGQENDISRFNPERLKTYMNKLYWPIIELAMAKGLYVIVRPPGVCPQTIKVGDNYHNYLLTVWDIVSKDERIKKYAGQVSLELANEPITVLDANGQNSNNALHDFFQPIVDKIRSNGYKGIIWSSGSGYQSQYGGYASFPITGDNIGYAVHFYPGWMGTDRSFDNNTIISQFKAQVPVVTSRPIVITEVDWSPADESGGIDHINEMGQPVYKNYGTWATGRSSQFGKVFKAVHDYYGNISMTLTHPHEYFDFNQLFSTGKVVPAFGDKKEPAEACAQFCFDWYKAVAKDHTIKADGTKYALTFKDYDGTVLSTSIVASGTPIAAPAAPSHSGYEFTGWTPEVPATMPGQNSTYTATYYKEPEIVKSFKSVSSIRSQVFAIVNADEKKALYGSNNQNMAVADYRTAFDESAATSYYQLEYVEGLGYRLKTLKADKESTHTCYGDNPCYLNAQPAVGGVTFNLGLANRNGKDIENGAIWDIQYVEGKGFTLKNVANGGYMAGTTTSNTPVYWTLCTFWEPLPEPLFADGTYYIYNVESESYLSNGAMWGTRSVLADQGIAYKVTYNAVNNKYTLKSGIKNANNALRPSDGFNDQSGEWEIKETEEGFLMYNGEKYFGHVEGSSIPGYTEGVTSGSVWQFVTPESRKALLSSATPDNPVDATVYIVAPDFLNADVANAAWTGNKVGGISAGDNALINNTNCEKWNGGSYVVSQKITDIPNGVYKLTAQAYYRHGGPKVAAGAYERGEEVLPELFANDKSVAIRSVFDEAKATSTAGWRVASGSYFIPDSQADAAACFEAGAYLNVIDDIVVTDNTLTIGVKREGAAVEDWTVFDTFRLTFYADKPIKTALKGDVNEDGEVNIADVAALIDMLIGKSAPSVTADVYEDGEINKADLDNLVNLIFGK